MVLVHHGHRLWCPTVECFVRFSVFRGPVVAGNNDFFNRRCVMRKYVESSRNGNMHTAARGKKNFYAPVVDDNECHVSSSTPWKEYIAVVIWRGKIGTSECLWGWEESSFLRELQPRESNNDAVIVQTINLYSCSLPIVFKTQDKFPLKCYPSL